MLAEGDEPTEDADDYFARLNLYSQMAHFVGKVLHIRPNEILDTWGVPELIVAYGEYANEISKQNYEQWKAMDAEQRGRVGVVDEYAVEFYGLDKLED